MLAWNKELLLKRRTNILQTFHHKDSQTQESQTRDLQTIVTHLRRLLYLYLTAKFNDNDSKEMEKEIDSLKPLSIPLTFEMGDQIKLIKTMNRRIKNFISTFGKETQLETNLDECYQKQIYAEKPSSQEYFRQAQGILFAALIKLKKSNQKPVVIIKKQHPDPERRVKIKKSKKSIEESIINELYSVLDIGRVEALDYIIDGLDYEDNISLAYRHQKPRNKNIKKQIKEYVVGYENRLFKDRAKSNEKNRGDESRRKFTSLSEKQNPSSNKNFRITPTKSIKSTKSKTVLPKIGMKPSQSKNKNNASKNKKLKLIR